MEEVWKDIFGYYGLYKISNLGRVKSVRNNNEKILSQYNSNGYRIVVLSIRGKNKRILVHRLVATHFIENPMCFTQVNHMDENKSNNHVDNLEWCSPSYNINYGTRTERAVKTKIRPRSKEQIVTYMLSFTDEDLNKIRDKANEQGKTIKDFILDAIAHKMKDGE